jgi:hypothetical protein
MGYELWGLTSLRGEQKTGWRKLHAALCIKEEGRKERNGRLAPGIALQNQRSGKRKNDRSSVMDSGWYGARLQRGARLPTHIATRCLVSLSVHRAHDPIAALERQRGGIEPARRDRQRQRQHSDNCHKPLHCPSTRPAMLIPFGK